MSNYSRMKKSTKQHDIAVRRKKISELYKKRYYQAEIAEELGIDPSLVSLDLKAMNETFKEEMMDNLIDIKVRELHDYNEMEKICIEKLAGITDPKSGSRWIEERRKIKQAKAKLLGLDSPVKFQTQRVTVHINKEQRDAVVLAALGGKLPAIEDKQKALEMEKINTIEISQEPEKVMSDTDMVLNSVVEREIDA